MKKAGTSVQSAVAWLLVLWSVLPFVPLAIWSFAHGWRFPDLVPRQISLAAWSFAFSDASGVLASLGTTTVIAVLATALSLLIGLPAARALGLYRFYGKGLVQTLILAPVLVPGLAVALGLHGVFLTLGLTNTLAGVVVVHLIPTLPYMILILTAAFERYDTAYEEQARSLGATSWQTFRMVTLPMILPAVIVGSLFTFLISWSQFILTLMIGGGRVATLPLLLFGFATAGRNDLTAAISLIYILPGLLILIVTSRHLSGRPDAVAHP
jgi:putative spermidine/putrescine transport system permease protein